MCRVDVNLPRAVGIAEVWLRSCFLLLAEALTSEGRERRVLRAELRRFDNDAEFAAEWRAEATEGWRRAEFDRALSKLACGRSDGEDSG